MNKTYIKKFLSPFIPREGFYITPIIMDLNIIIFIIMAIAGLGYFSLSFNHQSLKESNLYLFSFKDSDLFSWGANFKSSIISGELWRLLTCIFLHGGLLHLILNMYVLYFVGIFLEPRLSKTKYAVIYLVTGILASITILWKHDGTISVGASGAIFGLYGVILSLLLTKNVLLKDFSKPFLRSIVLYVAICILLEFMGGDNVVHIAGLISGFIIGLIFIKKKSDGYEYHIIKK
ncbi:MAG: rhomboid family intramembrane serine protease [Bacteroidales bacterium]|jgi:membrane associated rhomboid family serine protease